MAKRQLPAGLRAPISKRRRTAKEGGPPTGALSTATEPDTAVRNREGRAAPHWPGARNGGREGAGLVLTNSLTSIEEVDDGTPMAGTAGVGAADCDIQASTRPADADEVSSSDEVEGRLVVEEQTAVKCRRQTKPRSVRGRGAGRASPGTESRGSAAAAASTGRKQYARPSTSVRGRARGKCQFSGRGIQASVKPDNPDQVSSSNEVEGRSGVEEQTAVECQRQAKPRSRRGRGGGRASSRTGKRGSAAAPSTAKKQGERSSVRGGVRGKRPASGRGRGRGRGTAAAKLRTNQEDEQDKEDGDGVSAAGGTQPSEDAEAPAGTITENCEEGEKAKPTHRICRRAGKRVRVDIDVAVEDQGAATHSNARAERKRRAHAKPTRRKPRRAEKPKREPGDIDVVVEGQGTATPSNTRPGKKRRAQAMLTPGQCGRTQYKAYEVREAFDMFLEDLETTCKQRGVTMTADELQRLALHRWSSMSIKEKAHCVARMEDEFSLGLKLSIRPWRLRMTLRDQATPADFVRQSKELYNWGRVRLR